MIFDLEKPFKPHTYSVNKGKTIFGKQMNVCEIFINIVCLHYRGLKARTGTSSENRRWFDEPLVAIGRKQPPFALPFPPTCGDTEHLTVGGGHQS